MKSVEEMIMIVQCYIHLLKDKELIIFIRNDRDVFLLTIAYNKAIEYFTQTNTTITHL
jgi:hypothetical protein